MLGHATLTACSSKQYSTPEVWAATFTCNCIVAMKSCVPVTQALENGVIQLMTIGHVHLTYAIQNAHNASCCTDKLKPCHAKVVPQDDTEWVLSSQSVLWCICLYGDYCLCNLCCGLLLEIWTPGQSA